MTTVAILGGGIAGLSAAHELIEREPSFKLKLYEKRSALGGKARSIAKPDSGEGGRHDLPGEHGFHLFSAFYHHLLDTMQRIELPDGRVATDNLMDTERLALPSRGRPTAILPTIFPSRLDGIRDLIKNTLRAFTRDLEMSDADLEFFGDCVLNVMTQSQARRADEMEKLNWTTFVDADSPARSPGYKSFVGVSLCCGLAAVRPRSANARVQADILIQLLIALVHPGRSAVRLLNGPTSQAWIDPWASFLEKKMGVEIHLNKTVQSLSVDKHHRNRIARATVVDSNGVVEDVEADYFVLALPVEAAATLLEQEPNQELVYLDPALNNIVKLRTAVDWMSAVIFYLNRRVDITRGHVLYVDSPWSLTSISQKQFWPDVDLSNYGNGQVRDILSVCLSDWHAPGWKIHKHAEHCTREEIKEEVWYQLKQCLNVDGREVIRDSDVVDWFLDPDITEVEEPDGTKHVTYTNAEPLMVCKVNTDPLRPDAWTRFENFFLAADYVNTNTLLPCMETANEAARRAVNGILEATHSRAPRCQIWPLEEPFIFGFWRWWDALRYSRGLKFQPVPKWLNMLQWAWLGGARKLRVIRGHLPARGTQSTLRKSPRRLTPPG